MNHWPAIFTTENPGNATAAIWFVVVSLGVYRLSRIIARDTISDKPRARMAARYHGSLVELVTCIWCLSFWFAIIAAVLVYFNPTRPWTLLVCAVLGVSAVAGLLGERG
ncbi:MAG TPA: DUF1360 domain-containing protein [Scandinavium sp.]|jgi:hypothetical protein|uniref:DUF1360 domain-containing protein n=1 Tax=Scandinavium sp. TaxID=2830653 RepID=UPI002E31618A|nr:DUF1360 domain-containing protein [Scandinavium sp.]HEX4503868.1 DUF1360 domain-containing protein [Scandinavium sp.]